MEPRVRIHLVALDRDQAAARVRRADRDLDLLARLVVVLRERHLQLRVAVERARDVRVARDRILDPVHRRAGRVADHERITARLVGAQREVGFRPPESPAACRRPALPSAANRICMRRNPAWSAPTRSAPRQAAHAGPSRRSPSRSDRSRRAAPCAGCRASRSRDRRPTCSRRASRCSTRASARSRRRCDRLPLHRPSPGSRAGRSRPRTCRDRGRTPHGPCRRSCRPAASSYSLLRAARVEEVIAPASCGTTATPGAASASPRRGASPPACRTGSAHRRCPSAPSASPSLRSPAATASRRPSSGRAGTPSPAPSCCRSAPHRAGRPDDVQVDGPRAGRRRFGRRIAGPVKPVASTVTGLRSTVIPRGSTISACSGTPAGLRAQFAARTIRPMWNGSPGRYSPRSENRYADNCPWPVALRSPSTSKARNRAGDRGRPPAGTTGRCPFSRRTAAAASRSVSLNAGNARCRRRSWSARTAPGRSPQAPIRLRPQPACPCGSTG